MIQTLPRTKAKWTPRAKKRGVFSIFSLAEDYSIAMKIRLAEKEDAPAIMALLLQIANLHVGLRPDLFVLDVPKYDEKELLGMLGNEEKPIYVAEKDGVVVAHLFCQCKIIGTTKQKIFYLKC